MKSDIYLRAQYKEIAGANSEQPIIVLSLYSRKLDLFASDYTPQKQLCFILKEAAGFKPPNLRIRKNRVLSMISNSIMQAKGFAIEKVKNGRVDLFCLIEPHQTNFFFNDNANAYYMNLYVALLDKKGTDDF